MATYIELTYQARKGTAENLAKLLKAFGHDKEAVEALQNGVSGNERILTTAYDPKFGDNRPVESGDIRPVESYDYRGPSVETAAKNNIMADFYAKLGQFAPQTPAPDALQELTDKFNAVVTRLEAAEEQLRIIASSKAPDASSPKPKAAL